MIKNCFSLGFCYCIGIFTFLTFCFGSCIFSPCLWHNPYAFNLDTQPALYSMDHHTHSPRHTWQRSALMSAFFQYCALVTTQQPWGLCGQTQLPGSNEHMFFGLTHRCGNVALSDTSHVANWSYTLNCHTACRVETHRDAPHCILYDTWQPYLTNCMRNPGV